MPIYSLYKTTNLVNDKIYYGIHKETKWPETDEYLGSGRALLCAIHKHSRCSFKRKILCISDNIEYIYFLESCLVTEKFINEHANYNLCVGGVGIRSHSYETRLKMRKAKLGKKRPPFSKEHKAKLSAASVGKTCSLETKLKISTSHKGKSLSMEHKAKISAASRGKTHSQKSKAKMCRVSKGRNARTCWYHDPITLKRVRRERGKEPDGFVLGYVPS